MKLEGSAGRRGEFVGAEKRKGREDLGAVAVHINIGFQSRRSLEMK